MPEAIQELHGNEIAALLIPTTVTLVTARDASGDDKVATIAWAMPISHEPSLIAVSIRPGGQTSRAMERGCFVVNVLGAGQQAAAIAAVCGKKSGVDDRIAQAGLALSDAKRVDAARVGQAVSWIECEVESHEPHGDHELFIGRTLVAETRGELSEDGKVVPGQALLMGQRGRFGRFEED